MSSYHFRLGGRTDGKDSDALEGAGFLEVEGADGVVVSVGSYIEPGEPKEVTLRVTGDGWSSTVAMAPHQARELAARLEDAADADAGLR
ncbi:MAG: hypothetical protein R3324_01125 [Halobacteriales archaeon]|nr:hypothetical protein [Halobacteriales archaeon]